RNRRAIDLEAARACRARSWGGAVDADVLELARGSVAKTAVANADLQHARTRGQVTPKRRQSSLAGFLARHATVQRLVANLDLCVLSAQHGAVVVVHFEAAEVPALAAAAGAHDVAGDLIEVPDLM